MRNAELRSLGGIEKVYVLVMRGRLRWQGHVEKQDVCRVPKCLLVSMPVKGKRSIGGHKRRWNDVVVSDLKRGHLLEDCIGGRLLKTEVHGGVWW